MGLNEFEGPDGGKHKNPYLGPWSGETAKETARKTDNRILERNFKMTYLTDEQIKEAFTQIRAKFEKRNNNTGLEILDSYEDQWQAALE